MSLRGNGKGDTLETRQEIKDYLDEAIVTWRDHRDSGTGDEAEMAPFYIDAFQSVRMSIFGEILSQS